MAAVKVAVELDCDKLRDQLREVIREIVEGIIAEGPSGPQINTIAWTNLSPSSQKIANDIAELIHGST